MKLLSSYIEFKNGKKRPVEKGNIPVYGGNGILDYTNKYNAEKGVVIGRVGVYCGSVNLIEEKSWISDNAIIALNRDNMDLDYMYYLLSSLYLNERRIGTSQPLLTQNILNNIKVDVPSLENQRKISSILKTIDRKILLNNEINNNLHQQSMLIVDNLLSVLDEYKILPLSEVADCQNGRAFYKEGYDEEGAFVVDLGNVNTTGNFVYTNADKYVSMDRYNSSSLERYRVFKNDLIMVMTDRKSTMDLLGKVGKIYKEGYYLLNQRMYRIRAKKGINTNYLYAYLNSTETCNRLKEKALGSVQKYVNTGDINSIPVKVPSAITMEEIANVLDPIFQQMENNILENESLHELRNMLLPKLMSGEFDVSDLDI